MNRKQAQLDDDGFPIAPGFEESSAGGRSWRVGPALRSLLRMMIVAGILVALSNHFDWPKLAGDAVADYLAERAVQQYNHNDLPAALDSINRAVSWSPDKPRLWWLRAQLNFAQKDYEAALTDAQRMAELNPRDVEAFSFQRHVLHILHRHRETAGLATDQLNKQIGDRAGLLNDRAYARANGEFDLEPALADIDEALKLSEEDNASLIDTRGYVLLKLGRHQEALDEFERAIELVLAEKNRIEDMLALGPARARQNREARRLLEQCDESLAVMYHHRGETHEKLGRAVQSFRDFQFAMQLGFNPDDGVY